MPEKTLWERFDDEFPDDTFVSAHQDWTYEAVKSFFKTELKKELEGMKKPEYMDMDEETQYFPENEKYNQSLKDFAQRIGIEI